MNKFMIASFAAICFGGSFSVANAAPSDAQALNTTPIPVSAAADLPYTVARLQGEISTLQAQVLSLQNSESQDAGGTTYFSADAPANAGGSPIPSGG